jgi:SAM-dependent methyltransferase
VALIAIPAGSTRRASQHGTAEQLPFTDASFDLVTCQTVLIHVPDPGAAIDEMIRVARPGGLILAAEPNNITQSLIFSSLNRDEPIDDSIARVRLQLTCERGKAALGEGNNSVGDLVPGLFAARGLTAISVHLNDNTAPMLPPYALAAERAALDEHADFANRDFWIWSRADTLRYFLAGGGDQTKFDALWAVAIGDRARFKQMVREQSFNSPGGFLSYIIAGRKRLSAEG